VPLLATLSARLQGTSLGSTSGAQGPRGALFGGQGSVGITEGESEGEAQATSGQIRIGAPDGLLEDDGLFKLHGRNIGQVVVMRGIVHGHFLFLYPLDFFIIAQRVHFVNPLAIISEPQTAYCHCTRQCQGLPLSNLCYWMFAPWRFAPWRSAIPSFAPRRSAPSRFASTRYAPARFAP